MLKSDWTSREVQEKKELSMKKCEHYKVSNTFITIQVLNAMIHLEF